VDMADRLVGTFLRKCSTVGTNYQPSHQVSTSVYTCFTYRIPATNPKHVPLIISLPLQQQHLFLANPICLFYLLFIMMSNCQTHAGPSGRKVEGVGLRLLACWDCRFESHRRHGYLSTVNVVCCQVEVSTTSWSRVQMSPTDC